MYCFFYLSCVDFITISSPFFACTFPLQFLSFFSLTLVPFSPHFIIYASCFTPILVAYGPLIAFTADCSLFIYPAHGRHDLSCVYTATPEGGADERLLVNQEDGRLLEKYNTRAGEMGKQSSGSFH